MVFRYYLEDKEKKKKRKEKEKKGRYEVAEHFEATWVWVDLQLKKGNCRGALHYDHYVERLANRQTSQTAC